MADTISATELCRRSGLGRVELKQLCDDGKIRYEVKPSGRYTFHVEQVAEDLETLGYVLFEPTKDALEASGSDTTPISEAIDEALRIATQEFQTKVREFIDQAIEKQDQDTELALYRMQHRAGDVFQTVREGLLG